MDKENLLSLGERNKIYKLTKKQRKRKSSQNAQSKSSVRRKIEQFEGRYKLKRNKGLEDNKEKVDVMSFRPEGASSSKAEGDNISDSQNRSESVEEVSALFVYEPDDLLDVDLQELKQIWNNRLELCGSIEVAAEVLALLEVDGGIVEHYRGWQHYIEHTELLALKDKLESKALLVGDEDELYSDTYIPLLQRKHSAAHEVKSNVSSQNNLSIYIQSLSDLEDRPPAEISSIWTKRPSSMASINIACEILALMRYQSGIDTVKKNFTTFRNHPAIEELKDELPEFVDLEHIKPLTSQQENNSWLTVEEMKKDSRESKFRAQKQRIGQGKFREMILSTYSFKCCITGCSEKILLEAAHIIPYMGIHSNTLDNGLCLRSDIHKLFDMFLLSISPTSNAIVISEEVQDDYYRSLNGKAVFSNGIMPSKDFIASHYRTFEKKKRN